MKSRLIVFSGVIDDFSFYTYNVRIKEGEGTVTVTSAKARLNLSIDSELKQEVGEVLQEMGLDYTTAITLYFHKIRRDRKIPFEVEAPHNKTVDEFLGSNWRNGLERLEDDWT